MERRILMEKRDNRIRTYFLEDGDIVEIHSTLACEGTSEAYRLGDVYIGKVKNIVPNIGAAFVEIGGSVNCYFDMKDAQNAHCDWKYQFYREIRGDHPRKYKDRGIFQDSEGTKRYIQGEIKRISE